MMADWGKSQTQRLLKMVTKTKMEKALREEAAQHNLNEVQMCPAENNFQLGLLQGTMM